MEDLGIKLHPVKRLQLWRAIKKVVFGKMTKDVITPKRADEILGNLKPQIIEVNSPKQAKDLYKALPDMFPELIPVTHKFEIEEAEAIDRVLSLLLDEIMKKGEFEVASDLMSKIEISKDHTKLVEELQTKFPAEMSTCLKRYSQRFI